MPFSSYTFYNFTMLLLAIVLFISSLSFSFFPLSSRLLPLWVLGRDLVEMGFSLARLFSSYWASSGLICSSGIYSGMFWSFSFNYLWLLGRVGAISSWSGSSWSIYFFSVATSYCEALVALVQAPMHTPILCYSKIDDRNNSYLFYAPSYQKLAPNTIWTQIYRFCILWAKVGWLINLKFFS